MAVRSAKRATAFGGDTFATVAGKLISSSYATKAIHDGKIGTTKPHEIT